MSNLAVFTTGFGFSFSLIVAIGAQNAHVLRQGLTKRHVLPVVAICVLSDIVLTSAGIAGFGTMVENAPWLITAMRVFGGVFLVLYGLQAFRRALQPNTMVAEADGAKKGLWQAVAATAAVTYLNPHVYLDTVVLLGSLANGYGDQRWIFGLGAMATTATWFTALGFLSRYLQPLFSRPKSWQVLDIAIAGIMMFIAFGVLKPLFA